MAVEPQHDSVDRDDEPKPPQLGIFERVNNYLLLVYAFACFLMYYSISGLLFLRGQFLLSLSLPGVVAFLIPLLVLSKRFSLTFSEEYKLRVPDMRVTAMALLISGSVVLPVDVLSSILEKWWPPEADYINFLLAIKPKGMLHFIGVAAGTIIVAPFGEELIFRGFILRIFQRNMRAALAIVLASLVFGLAHFSLAILPGVTLLGLVFGYLFYRTGNLCYPIFSHALYNLVSMIRLHLTSESEIRSHEPGPLPVSWTLLSLLALVLGILLLERQSASRMRDRT